MPLPTTLTLLGHSCALVEVERPDGTTARLLLDPGNLTPPLTGLGEVDAVLVTHAHPDHLDVAQLQHLGGATVHGDAAVVAAVAQAGGHPARELAEGTHEIAGVEVVVAAADHETIYPGLPLPVNLTFTVAGRVHAPGDALTVPDGEVEVLLLPLGAPWMKLSEAVDHLRAVRPRVAVPVHDAGLAPAHRAMHRGLVARFAHEGTEVVVLETGEAHVLTDPA